MTFSNIFAVARFMRATQFSFQRKMDHPDKPGDDGLEQNLFPAAAPSNRHTTAFCCLGMAAI
jgi:hypothetical protein